MHFISLLAPLALLAGLANAGHSKPNRLNARQAPCFIVGGAPLPGEVQSGLASLASVVACDHGVSDRKPTIGPGQCLNCLSIQSQISPGVPNLISGATSLSSIDFQASESSPLGFAEDVFVLPEQPSTTDAAAITALQEQLNVYLAWETAVRSQVRRAVSILPTIPRMLKQAVFLTPQASGNSRLLTQIKSVKFYLQFQQARLNAAKGIQVGAAGTVEHQLGKVGFCLQPEMSIGLDLTADCDSHAQVTKNAIGASEEEKAFATSLAGLAN